MKRVFLLLIAVLATIRLSADTMYGSCGEYINWYYDGNELDIYGWGEMDNFDLQVSYMRPPWYGFREHIQKIRMSNGITTIGDYAFKGCSYLNSFVISEDVTSIGESAFEGCGNLMSITIPKGVTNIKFATFSNCSSLTSITIPNTVTSIGTWAFLGCGLTSITIPNSVTSIANDAFLYCGGLKSVVVEEGNTIYDSRGDCNAIIETATNTLRLGCKNTTIPNDVRIIGENAFSGCVRLKSITIPHSVTSIEGSAFYGCDSLTSITIPNSVVSVNNSAFCDTGLSSIIVENDNKKYDSRNNCNAIIETATNTLIRGCKGTTIPDDVPYIGKSAFSQCHGLISVTISNNITNIGNFAFYNCLYLDTVIIPNSVTTIGNSAFSSCQHLRTISFGAGVTSIGESVLVACDSLYKITCYATEVPFTAGSIVFRAHGIDLYVPSKSVEKYKADPYWGVFNVLPIDDSVTTDIDNIENSNLYGDALSGNDIMGADSSCKVFHDGQVYILRGGKTYTLTGMEVK